MAKITYKILEHDPLVVHLRYHGKQEMRIDLVGDEWVTQLASMYGWNACHQGTDGTVDCPTCGKSAQMLGLDATEYVKAYEGTSAEDIGFFFEMERKYLT